MQTLNQVSANVKTILWLFQLSVALRLFCYYNKGLKEPTVSKFPSAKFKIFVNDRVMTKSTLLGVGKGYSSLHQR